MQRKKIFLGLVALCSIVGMGITSCNNQGEQGPIGPEGPQGPEGPAGENGQDGQDGSLILTGEGKPTDTLGKDSDIYIDSKTGDLYQKENGTWSLVMNIKGEDGSDGSSGSSGLDGKTAWSNTILPSEGGYVIPSVGSALEGSEVTFYIRVEDGYSFESLVINGTSYSEIEYVDGVGEFTTTMVENGMVIQANFVSKTEVTTRTTYFKDGVLYTGAELDAAGNVIKEGVAGDKLFESGSGSESDPLQVSTDEQIHSVFNNADVSDSNYSIKLNNDVSLDTIEEGVSFKGSIDLNGKVLTREDNSYINGYFGTLKNGTIVCTPDNDGSIGSFINIAETGSNFEDLTSGVPADVNGQYYTASNNNGPIVAFARSGYSGEQFTFKNVVNYYNLDFGAGYGSAILGGYVASTPNTPCEVIFDGCKNYGNLKGRDAAAFVGNYSAGQNADAKYTFKNCVNEGSIIGYNGANTFIACPGESEEKYESRYSELTLENNTIDESLVKILPVIELNNNFTLSKGNNNSLMLQVSGTSLPEDAATLKIRLSTYLQAYENDEKVSGTLLSDLYSDEYTISDLTSATATNLYVTTLNEEIKVDETLGNNETRWAYENGSYVVYHDSGKFNNGEGYSENLILKATNNITLMIELYNAEGEIVGMSSTVNLNSIK